jgi:hypothetical protein
MVSFSTSDLVRVDGSSDVYQLVPDGDTGKKLYLGTGSGHDLSSIYTINQVDFSNYILDQTASIVKAKEELNRTNNELIASQEAALKAQQKENSRIAEEAEKILLEQQKKELAESQAKLDRMTAGNEILAQMVSAVSSIDSEMSSLYTKISDIDAQIVSVKNQTVSSSYINARVYQLQTERNGYADQYNDLLADRNMFVDVSEAIVTYQDFGIAIPSKYRSFLNSYGIYY